MREGYFTKTRASSCAWMLRRLLLCLLTLSYLNDINAKNDQGTITLNVQNASLEEVFKAIEKQTQYSFLYLKEVLKGAKRVDVKVANASLEKVLEVCFKEQEGLTWSVMDRVVVVKVRSQPGEVPMENEAIGDTLPVSGRVIDDDGKPLFGANVKVKGTKQGAVTDTEGRFTLSDVPENAVLAVSYVGREAKEINVKGQTTLLISLAQKESILDETVVIAYGTTTKRLNTGNVGTVKGRDIAKQPINNPLLALQGRVAGLFITQSSGIAGGGVVVRIQGQNSIQSGNDPLYVVDGVPIVSQLPATGIDGVFGNSGNTMVGGGSTNGNPLNYINPSDIESIEILKDADATAIYGSRAANGAILITTKRGQVGSTKFNLNIQTGRGNVTRKLKMLNTSQYLSMRREAFKNDNIEVPNIDDNPNNTDFDINGTWDTTRYTDWQKTLIGNTATFLNFNAGISGGTPNLQYIVGGTYRRETTVFPLPSNFSDKKGSFHFGLNNISNDQKFRAQLSVNYMIDDNQLPDEDFTIKAIQLEPNAPEIFTENGTLNWAPNALGLSTWTNPLIKLYTKYQNKTTSLVSNLTIGYRIFKKLEFRSSFGYNNMQTNDFSSTPLDARKPEQRPTSQRSAVYGNRTINSWIIEPQLHYRTDLKNNKLEVLVGVTLLENASNGGYLQGDGYNSNQVLKDIRAAASVQVGSSFVNEYKYNAIFGRINYNLHNKYIWNITGRRDGSSKFGPSNRFHNFASVGAAWLFSEEPVFKSTRGFLSFGKLRGSYGTTGNDQIADYYYLNLYAQNTGNPAYQQLTGLLPYGLPNPYLQWEETRKLQIGLDIGLFANKVMLYSTFVKNRSSNQLLEYQLPSFIGQSSIVQNFPATIQNLSWELSIESKNIQTTKLTWSSSLNITFPKNEVVSFPNIQNSTYASGTNGVIVGQPLGIQKVFDYSGVDPNTGRYQFVKKDGTLSSTLNLSDRTALINTLPRIYGGIQNSIKLKGFELDFLFQFVKQTASTIIFNNGSIASPGSFRNGASNQPASVLGRWIKPGDIAAVRKYTTNVFGVLSEVSNARNSDGNYDDASYIRLKNLSLSWLLPVRLINAKAIPNCRLYFQAQNLITITNYKGLDPENRSITSLPPLRVLTVGMHIEL